MSMWHTVLQDASFKGVRFDVMNIEESNGKALVEHAKPFADGVLLEDMGTTGREVQVAAVFWGKQYHSRLNQLLTTLMESGSGVLLHPIWGRMPNMVAASWHYRHDADNVDYATLDITFRESGEPHKIFVFENPFLMQLERLIAQIDGYRTHLMHWLDTLTMAQQSASALWGSALGFWSVARGTLTAVSRLFGQNDKHPSADVSGKAWYDHLHQTVQSGLWHSAGINTKGQVMASSRSARQRFDEVLRQSHALHDVPRQVWSGLADPATHKHNRLQRASLAQVQMVLHILRLTSLAVVLQVACLLIEKQGDQMNAPDLLHLNRSVRLQVQTQIAALRALLQQAQAQRHGQYAQWYQHSHALIEAMRQASGGLNALVVAAINQKPPLIVRPAPFGGTMQQMAFALYGNIARSDELMRLNPHISHPNFIATGTPINGYVR